MKKVLEYGTLIKNTDDYKKIVEYEMVLLDESYLNNVLELQNKVYNSLDNLDTFVPDTKEFIEKSIFPPDQGRIIGVFTCDGLIAYRTINFPSRDEKNLGRDINLSKSNLEKVAHLESTVVHPDYRGNKIQAKMLPHSINIIKNLGYNFVLTTISPYNYPSLKNIMDHDFKIVDLKFRNGEYEGKLRYLLFRNLNDINPSCSDHIIILKNTDISKQQNLLQKGYKAYRIKKQKDYFDVFYCKGI